MVEIYSLSHPITKEVRYIGKANNSHKRLKSHLRDSKRRNTPLYFWIRKLLSLGLIPEINILKIIPSSQWKEEEIKTILDYKSKGVRLLNLALGGDEPFCPLSVRINNGRTNANKIHSNEKSKYIWSLKKNLGTALKFLKDNNRIEKYNEIILRLKSKGIIYG